MGMEVVVHGRSQEHGAEVVAEIADAVVFLASPRSGYVTGALLEAHAGRATVG